MHEYLIVSDLHLGSRRFKQYNLICNFLKNSTIQNIIFNGDTFEKNSIEFNKKKFPEFFTSIKNKNIKFISGNHDPKIGQENIILNINEKKILIIHGHQTDYVNYLVQESSVFFNEYLIKYCNLDFQGWYRKKFSRQMPNNLKMLPMLYRNRCRLIEKYKPKFDIIISGHTHYTEKFETNEITYYTAAILDASSYITIKNDLISTHKL